LHSSFASPYKDRDVLNYGGLIVTDHFAHKADSYDQDKSKRDNIAQIAKAIRGAIKLDRRMHIADVGSGTGLLLEQIAPHVGKISAIDSSPTMNAQLQAKLGQLACSVEVIELDLETATLDETFDGIISSMTLHHIKDVTALFNTFRDMLKDGGFIALADLDKEDGSFHGESEGVYHAGFNRDELAGIAAKAGFNKVTTVTASVINKSGREFPVFLLAGYR
jgi:cyclopropane fatty-acyl-phospholipid synthase-like methyltransferase